MKVLFKFILICCVILLVGCKFNEDEITSEGKTEIQEHNHTYASTLTYDDKYHWYPTTCNHQEEVTKIPHNIKTDIIEDIKYFECSDCGYAYQEEKALLTINYQFASGKIINTITDRLFKGDEYSYKSPQISYMIPSLEVVEGVFEEEITIDVIYDYSYENIDLKEIEPIIYDENEGVSLSMVTSGILTSNEELIVGDTFVVKSGSLILRNSVEANLLSASWEAKKSAVNKNDGITSLYSQIDDERLVTLSFTPEKNLEVYVNGKLQVVYFATVMSDGLSAQYNAYEYKLIEDFIDAFFKEINTKGFKLGDNNAKIRNVIIGKAFDGDDALELYSQFFKVKVNYQDENKKNIAVPTSLLGRFGDSYEISKKEIIGFIVDNYAIQDTFTANKEYKIVYQSIGQEHLPSGSNEINKPNTMEWGNTNTWYYFVNKLSGDYTVIVSYTLWANQFDEDGNYESWKTVLPIHFDANNHDRWVCRFDSYGWLDDVSGDGRQLGSNANHGSMYSENSKKEVQALCKGCDVLAVFTRRGTTLKMTSVITPIDDNNFTDEVYYWECSLENVTRQYIGIAATCEYASIKINSIKY